MTHILVVEDDPAIAEIMVQVLGEDLDARVDTAPNGLAALEMVHAETPDAMVVNLCMPGMDGRTFVQACQQEGGALAAVPVVVASAAPGAGATAEALGADAYVAKPFDIDQLAGAVARAL